MSYSVPNPFTFITRECENHTSGTSAANLRRPRVWLNVLYFVRVDLSQSLPLVCVGWLAGNRYRVRCRTASKDAVEDAVETIDATARVCALNSISADSIQKLSIFADGVA